MIKTLFWHQYLLHLGWENFFSHHNLYQKTFQIIFLLIFQISGPPLHYTSDRPCQLIIFPIEKSLHEFFFSNFSGARIFLFSVSPARFLLLPPPPITFLMVRPLCFKLLTPCSKLVTTTANKQCEHAHLVDMLTCTKGLTKLTILKCYKWFLVCLYTMHIIGQKFSHFWHNIKIWWMAIVLRIVVSIFWNIVGWL